MISQKSSHSVRNRTVFMDHDGHPEDITSLMLLLTMKNVDLIGISLTPADCYIESGVLLTLKALSLFGRSIELVVGQAESPNKFPDEFKMASFKANNLPFLINQPYDQGLVSAEKPEAFMVKKIKGSAQKVTVLMTGPCTHLSLALALDPSIKENIEEVVWMGGAIDVPGNIAQFSGEKGYEWNVWWDGLAAKSLLAHKLNLTLFSLDATNQIEVTTQNLKEMASHARSDLMQIVSCFYSLIYKKDPNVLLQFLYFWDTATTSYLGCDFCESFEQIEVDILTEGQLLGKMVRSPGCGQWVNVPKKVNKEQFFTFFVKSLSEAKIKVILNQI